MTCKDCIYYEICKDYLIECAEHGEAERINNPCSKFKNKADYVEVVRCKDCNHWIYWADEKRCSCELRHSRTHRDHFCGYGERKNGKDINVPTK